MDTLGLSLRQKKLLHLLRGVDTFTTGNSLARQLGVSPRTIRTDVAAINKSLAPYSARIYSEHSKGYLYRAEDPEAIQTLNRIDNAFLTRSERVRYLAFRFCLTDTPLNIYDLEDEIFVSHTTLEHDIRQLKIQYVLSPPRIRFFLEKENLSFEKDERKRRIILNQLFHADWDYHGRNNAYYGYHFLEADTMEHILDHLPRLLYRHNIAIEDPVLVSLNLAVAIMIHRVKTGHLLPASETKPCRDPEIEEAVSDLFSSLTKETGLTFSYSEQEEIGRMIRAGRLKKVAGIEGGTLADHFDSSSIALAEAFLKRVNEVFHLDFSGDEDFIVTLLAYIQYLQASERVFNDQENRELLHENLLPEFEIAWLFQDLAIIHLGCYITETELFYLARAVSGALEFFFETHPEYKLRTVICCHLNMTAAWALKRKILGSFDKYLNITDLLPVNAKDALDFSSTDLVLSTVRKSITNRPGTDTIQIHTLFPPEDTLTISAYIRSYRLRQLCPCGSFSPEDLLSRAIWLENLDAGSRFDVIETMAKRLIREGIVPQEYETDLLRREAISTFGIRSEILFLHSLVPAEKTQLCVAIFRHRLSWQSTKIRVAVMGAFMPGDGPVLLLLNQLLHSFREPVFGKTIPTREEVSRLITYPPT